MCPTIRYLDCLWYPCSIFTRIYYKGHFFSISKKAKYCHFVRHIVHKNPGDNPEVRYIEFLLMDSGSKLSPEQDPVVWKIFNFGHFALNNAN